MIRFVASTRHTEATFFIETLLGQSLRNMQNLYQDGMSMHIAFAASDGLAAVYNPVIEQSLSDDILVFVHDDVRIDDWWIEQRLKEALAHFDVVGVAGTRWRDPQQRVWWADIVEQKLVAHDSSRRSGTIAHLNQGRTQIDSFGPAPHEVKLLDGVFIAALAGTLQQHQILFDAQFKYHYYDLDFCRQVEAARLKMGTWPIALTHGSEGSYSQDWWYMGTQYLQKWGD